VYVARIRFLRQRNHVCQRIGSNVLQAWVLMELLVSNLVDLLNRSFNLKEGFSQRRTEAYKF